MKTLTDEFDSYDFDEIVDALVGDGYEEDDVNSFIENGFEGDDDNELEFEARFIHPMCGYNNSWQASLVKASLRKLGEGSYQLKAMVEVGSGALPSKYAYELESGYMDCDDAVEDLQEFGEWETETEFVKDFSSFDSAIEALLSLATGE